MRKIIVGAVALASATLGLSASASIAVSPAPDRAPLIKAERRSVDGQYIVMLNKGMSSDKVRAAASRARDEGATVRHVYSSVDGYSAALTQSELDAVRNDPSVAYVEQVRVMRVDGTQTDPTWGLDRSDQRDLPLSGSYASSATGLGVKTYVVDSGVNATHHEFTGRVGTGYSTIADGLGTGDCNGHGTHVSGTIAGTTYGVAKEATVIPVRVLDCDGSGWSSDVIAGLDWIAGVAATGPRVANMSLGGSASPALDDAVTRLVNSGVAVVVSAGNDNQDACLQSPSRATAAITVGSSTMTDARSSFSNWGPCVDLFAPGSNITSAWFGYDGATNTISGTSMASPHVAGAAALHLQENPSASPATIANALIADSTVGKITDPQGSPNRLLFTDPISAPSAPTGVVAVRGERQATVSWTAPAANGSPITTYTVTSSPSGATVTVPATQTTATLTGLTDGTTYSLVVTATNALGTSDASEEVQVTPGPPDLSAPSIGDFMSSARMLDPFFHSGSTTIRVRLTDDTGIAGSPHVNIGPNSGDEWYDYSRGWVDSLSAPLSLAKGNRRDGIWTAQFSLDATTSTGSWSAWTTVADGAERSSSVARGDDTVFSVVHDPLLGTAPRAPSQVTATAGNGRAKISWPGATESVSDYTVWASPGLASVTVDGNQTSAMFEGLANNTAYSFTVVAGNQVAESPASPASPVVTPTSVPRAPGNVTASAGDGSAILSWQSSYLAADISSYRVTSRSSDGVEHVVSISGASTSADIDGLSNGTAYTFTVAATNAAGTSPSSGPSNTITPKAAPSRPTGTSAVRGSKRAAVSWDAPAESGGSPITSYTVTAWPGRETVTVPGDTESATVAGLTNGTAYTFTVTATNAVGDSQPSAASNEVTPAGVPARMRAPKVVVRGSKAIVKWSAANPNGSPITRYKIDISKGKDKTRAASARKTAFKGLKPGRYKVRISARNGIGTGPFSSRTRFRIR